MVYVWLAAGSSIIGLAALLYGIVKLNGLHNEPEERRRECHRSISYILYISAFFIFLSIIFIMLGVTMQGKDKKVKKMRSHYNPGSTRRGDASRRVIVEPYQQPAVAGGNSVRLTPGSSITISSP
jgi:hypothetical protein